MRVSVKIDSASTDELRELLRAYARTSPEPIAAREPCGVRLNGSEFWAAETPPMSATQGRALMEAMSDA